MDPALWLLAIWLPIAGVVLALCLEPEEGEEEENSASRDLLPGAWRRLRGVRRG
jgi:hypothetical protein